MKVNYITDCHYIPEDEIKCYGLHAIFNNKEEAKKCAKIMTEQDADIDCHYTVYENMIYNSLDEWEVR